MKKGFLGFAATIAIAGASIDGAGATVFTVDVTGQFSGSIHGYSELSSFTGIYLNPRTLSPVPEPATWFMMTAGFALIALAGSTCLRKANRV